ncbi:hypothetical protein [Paracoccus suum]|uniref:hypothetical protein n=1 Tax=Paracoccus suum TaxID=2259340 RepID=UPI0018EF6D63|nr:hypothetical protein [Paracoccus suum]
MRFLVTASGAALGLMLAAPAMAAEATAEWPCVQPRQPHLSIGQMWTGPAPTPQAEALAKNDQTIDTLAETLALRRVPIDSARELIDAFAVEATPEQRTALMLATLARVDRQRTAILDGITRYGEGQADLARHVAERRATLDAMAQEAKPDFDKIDAEEEKLDWDQRIFEERRQMLSAVCESPVLMEQRLFEIARLIAAAPEGAGGSDVAGTEETGAKPDKVNAAGNDTPVAGEAKPAGADAAPSPPGTTADGTETPGVDASGAGATGPGITPTQAP